MMGRGATTPPIPKYQSSVSGLIAGREMDVSAARVKAARVKSARLYRIGLNPARIENSAFELQYQLPVSVVDRRISKKNTSPLRLIFE
jgi:hypothetical protein